MVPRPTASASPVRWMIGASITVWLAASLAFGARSAVEMLLGMAGPLMAASATWVAVERTYRAAPERVTALMVSFFLVKMVFFGAYVTFVAAALPVRPLPFAISFTGYFIGLHMGEAVCLRRLFSGRPVAPAAAP